MLTELLKMKQRRDRIKRIAHNVHNGIKFKVIATEPLVHRVVRLYIRDAIGGVVTFAAPSRIHQQSILFKIRDAQMGAGMRT